MDDLTDEQIEAYLKQRKVKAKQSKAKVVIKIEEKIVLDDLVDEIITTYTEAQKRAIYKHRAKNKENYNKNYKNRAFSP